MRRVCALYIFLLGILFSFAAKAAGEVQWLEFENSQQQYGRVVAALNLQTVAAAGVDETDDGETHLVLLAMKNAENSPDLSQCPPLTAVKGPDGRYTLLYGSDEDAERAVGYLGQCGDVLYAEQDQQVSVCSDITFYSWAAPEMGFSQFTARGGAYGTGSAEVAIVDSGAYMHSFYRSQVPVLGYDYVDVDEDPTNDLHGHGTHVAGIVADCTQGNSVTIYPVRVLDSLGRGKISNLINAVYEAADRGSDVINLSLTSFSESSALDNAILAAVDMGSVVVLAAGNNSCDTSEICPAHLTDDGVIVVASAEGTTESWSRASYSNWGDSVDLYAFGTGINSCSRSGGFVTESGTSMAAPHVSAACAIQRLLRPGISPESNERILKSASPSGLLSVNALVPQSYGFSLDVLMLDLEDQVQLPLSARPALSAAEIRYTVSDESVACVESGVLKPVGAGSAQVTAACDGLDLVSFTVTVEDSECSAVVLPPGTVYVAEGAYSGDEKIRHIVLNDKTTRVGNEAFSGCTGLWTIEMPENLTEIADDCLLGCTQAVALVVSGSHAETAAIENGWNYIAN